jgi:hypothetical protein
MPFSNPKFLRLCLASGLALAAAACSPVRVPPPTVSDMMEDRVLLDGILMKCNANPALAQSSSDCANARIAVERLAKQNEAAELARAQQEFERSREQLRQAQDKQKQEQAAASKKLDGYSLPVIPVDPPPVAAKSDPKPAVPVQSNP